MGGLSSQGSSIHRLFQVERHELRTGLRAAVESQHRGPGKRAERILPAGGGLEEPWGRGTRKLGRTFRREKYERL